LDVIAIDVNSTLPWTDTKFIGEFAWIYVDVPATFSQQFGDKQKGGFIDIVQPIKKGRIFDFENATLNLACRLEYVDWNMGTFRETGDNISDDIWAIVPAISLRPTAQTVIRLNYRIARQQDILGNPPAHIGGIQFGISSYF
jgi:hypothetical protein